MLTSLEIQNFKAFRNLKIEKLAKVNLFVGEGNTGKTTVLEAIDSLTDQVSLNSPSAFRRLPDAWLANSNPHEKLRSIRLGNQWVAHSPNTPSISGLPKVSAMTSHGDHIQVPHTDESSFPPKRSVLIEHGLDSVIPKWDPKFARVTTRMSNPEDLAKHFDRWTVQDGNEERFISFAHAVEPRIRTLRAKAHTGVPMLYASVGLPELIPLPLLGEGLNRLIEIYGAIIGEGANIVLIDEIENGLHWKALPKVWQGIKAVVDVEDVQIFATTHSIECIEAASEIFKGPPDDFAVHRLERRDDGEIHCVTMGEVELGRMLERGWEVR